MTIKEFKKVVKGQIGECYKLLLEKRGIYDSKGDCMSQFKEVASLTGQTPERVLLGFWLKHLSTILMCIREGKIVSSYTEHITDSINYLILLKCLYIERKKEMREDE